MLNDILSSICHGACCQHILNDTNEFILLGGIALCTLGLYDSLLLSKVLLSKVLLSLASDSLYHRPDDYDQICVQSRAAIYASSKTKHQKHVVLTHIHLQLCRFLSDLRKDIHLAFAASVEHLVDADTEDV